MANLKYIGKNILNHTLEIKKGNVSGSATSTGSFGQLVIGNGGDIILTEDQRIYFESDKGTYIETNMSDSLRAVAGGSQMLLLDYDTGNRAVFGNNTKVFIGSNNNQIPSNTLEVDGTISGSGILSIDGTANFASHITASGNISGSSATTASFGYLTLDGDAVIGGNLTLGDSAGDSISFGAEISSSLIPDADSTYDIGSSSKNWRFGHIEQLSATHITASGNFTGSEASSGSFGYLSVDGMKISSLATSDLSEFSSSIATEINTLSADIIALAIALG